MKAFNVETIPLWGRNLVDASAGTGKTYAIATLFVRLLLETQYRINQLLVVTFTEAATAELRGRIRGRLREALDVAHSPHKKTHDPVLSALVARAGNSQTTLNRLSAALHELDNVEISTIHGFCHKTLTQRAFQSDVTFNSELYGDPRPMIDELVLDFWATHAGPAQPALLAYIESERFNLQAARNLAHAVLRSPEARILPNRAPQTAAADFERFGQALHQARRIWQQHNVTDLIANSSIRKNPYNKRNTPTWASAVGSYLAHPPELFSPLPDCFVRFCTPALIAAGGHDLVEHELFRACDLLGSEYEQLKARLSAELVRFKLDLRDYILTELPKRTRVARQLSFDDLLQRLHAALCAERGGELAADIRGRYPAALIDEFQDTDPIQLEIFERIYDAPQTSLFLIGDPKQAIYSFRGADVFSYVKAARATPSERHYTMTVNYRSDPAMVSAVNALFSSTPHPFILEDIQFEQVSARPDSENLLSGPDGPEPSGLEILFTESPDDGKGRPIDSDFALRELPGLVARDIQALLCRGLKQGAQPLSPADIAVLTRTNDQAFHIQAALRDLGVASVVLGDKSVYLSAESADLERVLEAILQPTHEKLVRSALSTRLLGLSANQLAQLDDDDEQWEGWLSDFRDLNAIWSHTGFVQMFRTLLARRGVQTRLLELSDGERRLTNLLHLAELLHAASLDDHLGPSGLFTFFVQQRRRGKWGIESDSAQIRLESDDAAVKLTTMHKSKGLEYPIVYCPYLWHGMLLHQADEQIPKFHAEDGVLTLDLGSTERAESLERARWEQFAENLRLLYVALTRARHRCVVVWGRIGKYFSTSALGYLLHPPAGAEAMDLPTIKAHLAGLSDEALLEDLSALSRTSEVRLRLARDVDESLTPQAAPSPSLHLQRSVATHRIDDRFRISSFSALTSHAHHGSAGVDDLLRDHDAQVSLDAAFPSEGDLVGDLRLAEFPRGTKAGSFFHDILEHYDFQSPRPRALTELVESKLGAYRYPTQEWTQSVCAQIFDVLDTPLPPDTGAPVRLADIAEHRRLCELEFCLPVALGDVDSSTGSTLASADLAQVFEDHPSAAVPVGYVEALRRIGFIPLRGYLRGFIDLIFEQGGRYFLVDYKGNHLGKRAIDYAQPALAQAMAEGQYFLQYHLYTLALHRHLEQRLADYSYARDFGGAFYLFLKGMGPSSGTTGVFFEKPPWSRLQALSDLLRLGA